MVWGPTTQLVESKVRFYQEKQLKTKNVMSYKMQGPFKYFSFSYQYFLVSYTPQALKMGPSNPYVSDRIRVQIHLSGKQDPTKY